MNQRQLETSKPNGHQAVAIERWHGRRSDLEFDQVAEEQPVALIYNGISYAVMMTTPEDLEDFALGFSLSEGLIQHPKEIYDIELEQADNGWLVQINLAAQRMLELKERRRNLAGRTGCGLCGTESLDQAIRPTAKVTGSEVPSVDAIEHAQQALSKQQPLQALTGATHAAAWCDMQGQILELREDIGRHNALDKLIGLLVKQQTDLTAGFLLISSRASYEMVQKASSVGISTLIAVSAPTALATQMASDANMNLIGFARPGRFVIYSRSAAAEQETIDA